MRKCRFCAAAIDDAATVCQHCGHDLIPGRHIAATAMASSVTSDVAPSEKAPAAPMIARVSVIDIDMPIGSMVVFMLKWAIAAIPAFLILAALGMFLTGMFAALSMSSSTGTSSSVATPASTEARVPTRASDLRGLSYAQIVDRLGPPVSQGPGVLRYRTTNDQTFTVFIESDRVQRLEPPTLALDQLSR